MSDIGRVIKEQRIVSGLTMRKLGDKSGVSSSHLGRIERGERFPSAHVLRRLAKPLGFEEVQLLGLAGYLSPPPEAIIGNSSRERLDPYVAAVLSQESFEVQRAVIAVLTVLKGMARSLLRGSDGRSEEKP